MKRFTSLLAPIAIAASFPAVAQTQDTPAAPAEQTENINTQSDQDSKYAPVEIMD